MEEKKWLLENFQLRSKGDRRKKIIILLSLVYINDF